MFPVNNISAHHRLEVGPSGGCASAVPHPLSFLLVTVIVVVLSVICVVAPPLADIVPSSHYQELMILDPLSF